MNVLWLVGEGGSEWRTAERCQLARGPSGLTERAGPPTILRALDVSCQNCGASLVVSNDVRTTQCPYCASPQIVLRPPSPNRPLPTFTIPFAVGEQPARERVLGWLKTRGFFRDPKLKTASITDMRGVYVPAYLYAAVAHSTYRADIGENYQETETYTTTDSKGNSVTRTRTVTKTEWRPLSGAHSSYVMDVVVTASRGLPNAELEAVEPFDLRQMRRYDDAFISGWIAEEPTVSWSDCMQMARGEALQKVGAVLARFMPGDSHRGLTHSTRLEHETADGIYVPVWVLAAMHDPRKPPVRIVMNGQSGAIFGRAPLSALRITVAVVVALVVIVGIVLVIGALS